MRNRELICNKEGDNRQEVEASFLELLNILKLLLTTVLLT
jgi:hypothetical protein